MSKPLKLKQSTSVDSLPAVNRGYWKILVVDDDPEVLAVSEMILSRITFQQRGMTLLSASSAAEAKVLLASHNDIAIALLDVVMESDDAGLQLVRYIRDELKNSAVRIILRTGQPGQAPEEQVIVDYDINDYKSKAELSSQKLFTTVIASLRSYQHIHALNLNRIGLEKVIRSAGDLFRYSSMREFSSGVLTQLSAYMNHKPEGLLCFGCPSGGEASHEGCLMKVVAAAGSYTDCLQCQFDTPCHHQTEADLVAQAMKSRTSVFEDGFCAIYIPSVGDEDAIVALIKYEQQMPSAIDRSLLEVFSHKIALGYHNVRLLEQLEKKVEERTAELAAANRALMALARIDSLTGQRTRRDFDECAAREMARANRYGSSLAVLFIDVDSFKAVNDRFGHQGGDEALRRLGGLMTSHFRGSDAVGRLGGDEFAALLPALDGQEAVMVAERLRQMAKGLNFTDFPGMGISLSIGVSTYVDGDTIESMMQRADTAMYDAKHEGRDRVVVAASENDLI